MSDPVKTFELTAGQSSKYFAAPVWMTFTIKGDGAVNLLGAVGDVAQFIPSDSDFATLRTYSREGVYNVNGLPSLLRFSCVAGTVQIRAEMKATAIPHNLTADEVLRGIEQVNNLLATNAIEADSLTTRVPTVTSGTLVSLASHKFVPALPSRNVNLSLAHTNSVPTSNYRASYPVTGTGFTQEMVGQALTAAGVTAFVIRVNNPTQLWVDRPMGTPSVPLGNNVPATFTARRWGNRVIPLLNQTGAWVQQTDDDTVYAYDFGFRPDVSKTLNTIALQRALDYAVTFGKYRVVIGNGIYQCGPIGPLSTNLRIDGTGQCIIDLTGNTEYFATLADSLRTSNDQLGQQFTQNNQAGVFGIIFRGFGFDNVTSTTDPSGYAFQVGDEAGIYTTAGSGYRMHIGLQGLKRGIKYAANNWTIQLSGWAYECDTVIEHVGGINTGENLIFNEFHMADSFSYAISCLGSGAAMAFTNCSVDNNRAALNIAPGAGGYDILFTNCWFEYRTGEEYLQAQPGHGEYCSVRIKGGHVIRNTDPFIVAPGDPNPGALVGLGYYNIPVILDDVISWSYGDRTNYRNGPRQVLVPQGVSAYTVDNMLWSSVLAPPRVELLNAPGVQYSLELGPTSGPNAVSHRQMIIHLAAPAPAGGIFFSVWA